MGGGWLADEAQGDDPFLLTGPGGRTAAGGAGGTTAPGGVTIGG